MAIFGVLEFDPVVQANDKIRLSAKKSYASGEASAITLVRIEPEAGAGFIDVTGTSSRDWFLDWQYADVASADKVVSVEITTDGAPVISTQSLRVLTAEDDNLFSDDSDLLQIDHDILRYVPEGKNSFLNYHRATKEHILDWFDQQGYTDFDGDKLTDAAFINKDELNKWSRNYTYHLILLDLSNDVEDVFKQQSDAWLTKALEARDRSYVRVDLDGDGTIDQGEFINLQTLDLVRE